MKVKVSHYYWFLLFLSAFTGIKGLPFLGELTGEASFYFLAPLLLWLIFSVKPNRYLFSCTLAISLYCLLVFLAKVTFGDISFLEFKGQLGVKRFVTQYILLCFFFITSSYLASIKESEVVEMCKKGYFFGLLFFIIFAFFEVLSWKGLDFGFSAILNKIRAEEYTVYAKTRLRGTQFESPSAAMFLNIILPWFYFHYKLKLKWLLCVLIVVLIVLTDSRSGLLLLLINIFLIMKFSSYSINYKFLFLFILIVLLFCTLVLTDGDGYIFDKIKSISISSDDNDHLASNLARWGSQYAAISIFIDNYVFGVGLGQAGFYLPNHYPDWATGSWNVKNWMDPNLAEWPPIFSMYTKILAELGTLGAVFIIYIIINTRKKLILKLNEASSNNPGSICFLINFYISIIVFLQYGSFRYLPFWICIAFANSSLKVGKRIEQKN